MSTNIESEYGIAMASSKDSVKLLTFSGNVEDFQVLEEQLEAALARYGIKFPTGGLNWMSLNQIDYATIPAHAVPLTQAQIDADNGFFNQQGRKAGDLSLTTAKWHEFKKDLEKVEIKHQIAVSLLVNSVIKGSFVETLIRPGMLVKDFSQMWSALVEYFRGKLLHIMLAIAVQYVNVMNDSSRTMTALQIIDKLEKLSNCYKETMKVVVKPTGETEEVFKDRQIKAANLWTMLLHFAKVCSGASDWSMVMDFVDNYFRKEMGDPHVLSIDVIWQQFRAHCSAHSKHVITKSLKVEDLVTDKTVQALTVQLLKANKELSVLKKRKIEVDEISTTDNRVNKCTFCGKKGHVEATCFKNPNASAEVKQQAAEARARWSASSKRLINLDVNFVSTPEPGCPELAGMM